MASDLTSQVLDALSESNDSILTANAFPSVSSVTVKSALDRLGSREMISYKTIDREEAVLTDEASGIVAEGSHEAKVFEAVRKAVEGLKIADLPVRRPDCMPARLGAFENLPSDSSLGTRRQGERKGRPRQGFQGGMDQEG